MLIMIQIINQQWMDTTNNKNHKTRDEELLVEATTELTKLGTWKHLKKDVICVSRRDMC